MMKNKKSNHQLVKLSQNHKTAILICYYLLIMSKMINLVISKNRLIIINLNIVIIVCVVVLVAV